MINRIWADRSGNFGILTALALVPLIGAAGMVIDFSRALTLRSDLNGAADAAALGAITEGSPGLVALSKMRQDGRVTVAEDEGRKLFLGHRSLNTAEDLTRWPLDVSIEVQRAAGAVTSSVSYSVGMPTTFMHIFGKTHVTVSGGATAVYGSENKTFTDFYMLLDNTPSMGIAATTKDIKKFQAITRGNGQRGCEFACHLGRWSSDGTFKADPNSSYIVARNNNITLRIDVVAKAAQALIDRVKAEMKETSDQYHVAAYSFGKSALKEGYQILKVLSSTVDMSTASSAVGKVSIQTTDHDHFHENALTSFDTALTLVGKEIVGPGGSGTSRSDPQKIVYFVTDGVADSLKQGAACGGSWYQDKGRCLEPIDTKYCKALKDRNIKIAILYTTYIPPDGDHMWETYMKKQFGKRISVALEECASEELFFEVGPDDDMAEAMAHLFTKAANSYKGLRLAF